MFSRQSSSTKATPQVLQPEPSLEQLTPPPLKPEPIATIEVPDATEVPREPPHESVIGPDLKILGGGLRLISEGNLTVDGVVEGDVMGANVTIGKHGQVNGLVHGETVSIQGHVLGMVRAVDVSLKTGANVEAEVHHNTLSLELGANFEGRSRRYMERSDLVPDLNNAASESDGASDTAIASGPVPLTS
ncbi:MAG: polymer-forming cytoskeletal protein [Alphaproteobacteria bacterium]|nr:polymer-forming cytoskeletal protein [Alphaproteobacteria bacterium]